MSSPYSERTGLIKTFSGKTTDFVLNNKRNSFAAAPLCFISHNYLLKIVKEHKATTRKEISVNNSKRKMLIPYMNQSW